MKRITGKKGFTLAELLIVVAIIGVLVAISIPIFTNNLKKARLATNQANARAAYAAAMAWYIENSDSTDFNDRAGGTYEVDKGVFTPAKLTTSSNAPELPKDIASWTVTTPNPHNKPDKKNVGETVYNCWEIDWTNNFDGTIDVIIAYNE